MSGSSTDRERHDSHSCGKTPESRTIGEDTTCTDCSKTPESRTIGKGSTFQRLRKNSQMRRLTVEERPFRAA